MSAAVRVGQRLRTTRGDYATVEEVGDHHITVSYQGKRYDRDPGIIGVRLFPEETRPIKAGETSALADQSPEKICRNCLEMRRDECFGQQAVCENFRFAPSRDKLRTNHWPTECDATRYRRASGRK